MQICIAKKKNLLIRGRLSVAPLRTLHRIESYFSFK